MMKRLFLTYHVIMLVAMSVMAYDMWFGPMSAWCGGF